MVSESNASFRVAAPGDAEVILTIVRAAYAKWVPIIGREPMPMKVDYGLALQKHRFDLLCIDGSVEGLIDFRKDHLWIENVAVRPASQGKGLGRLLLAHAEQLARDQKVAVLRLLTNAEFVDNVTLYKNLGYRIDQREPFMGGITLYMSKTL
jgi:GNAT superfamily N-acetyltransferase